MCEDERAITVIQKILRPNRREFFFRPTIDSTGTKTIARRCNSSAYSQGSEQLHLRANATTSSDSFRRGSSTVCRSSFRGGCDGAVRPETRIDQIMVERPDTSAEPPMVRWRLPLNTDAGSIGNVDSPSQHRCWQRCRRCQRRQSRSDVAGENEGLRPSPFRCNQQPCKGVVGETEESAEQFRVRQNSTTKGLRDPSGQQQ